MAEGGAPTPPLSQQREVTHALSFIDFVPYDYECFSSLVTMANDWLKQNPFLKVVTCEVRTIAYGSRGLDPLKTTYTVFGNFSSNKKHFFRCLRLWMASKTNDDPKAPQQIRCLVKVPDVDEDGMYEYFTDTVRKLNETFQATPLSGKVINLQTVTYKVSSHGEVNVERTDWHVFNEATCKYVNVLHLFYEVGPTAYESIGFADFTPIRPGAGYQSSNGKYQDLLCVAEKASQWIAAQRDIRVCNVQSINSKVKTAFGEKVISTTRPLYTENRNGETQYLRYIRVIYTKSPNAMPRQLSGMSYQNFEVHVGGTQSDQQTPINNWIQQTRSQVVSAETVAMSETKHADTTYTKVSASGKTFRFIIRVYV